MLYSSAKSGFDMQPWRLLPLSLLMLGSAASGRLSLKLGERCAFVMYVALLRPCYCDMTSLYRHDITIHDISAQQFQIVYLPIYHMP